MERRIPFEITAEADPFYSKSNIRHLERIMSDIEAGKAHFAQHELIEDLGDNMRLLDIPVGQCTLFGKLEHLFPLI